jgi:hypothetical protein
LFETVPDTVRTHGWGSARNFSPTTADLSQRPFALILSWPCGQCPRSRSCSGRSVVAATQGASNVHEACFEGAGLQCPRTVLAMTV